MHFTTMQTIQMTLTNCIKKMGKLSNQNYRKPHRPLSENLKQSIFAARKCKGWKEFTKCGYKYSQNEKTRDKRIQRMLLVGKAIDAFEEVPKEEKGS